MCEPITLTALTAIAAGTAVIGAGVGAASAAGQRGAARSAGTVNAYLADTAAADAVQRVATAQMREFSRGTATTAAQRVALAQGGGDVNAGSGFGMQLDTATLTSADEDQIRNAASREAYGYRTKAQQDLQQARHQEDAADYQEAGGLISGIGKIAGIAGPRIADKTGWAGGGAGSPDFDALDKPASFFSYGGN